MVCMTPGVVLNGPVEDAAALPLIFRLDENIVTGVLVPSPGTGESQSPEPATIRYYPDFTVQQWANGTTTWAWTGSDGTDSSDSSAFLRITVSFHNYLIITSFTYINYPKNYN